MSNLPNIAVYLYNENDSGLFSTDFKKKEVTRRLNFFKSVFQL